VGSARGSQRRFGEIARFHVLGGGMFQRDGVWRNLTPGLDTVSPDELGVLHAKTDMLEIPKRGGIA